MCQTEVRISSRLITLLFIKVSLQQASVIVIVGTGASLKVTKRKRRRRRRRISSSRTTRKKESAFKSSSVLPSEDAVSLYGPYPSQVPIPFVNKEGDTPGDEALMKATTYKDLEGYSDYRDRGTPDEWVPRDGRLIRLTGRHPFNVEPPMDILYQNRFITPSSLHYVRNHGACPRLLWDTHILEVAGISVKKKFKAISMDKLANMGPTREIPVTVACAGNRRKEQNMIRRTIGFNWGPCAVATSVWKGVLVRDLLLAAGVSDDPHTMFGLHVEFLGFEDLPNKVGPGPFPEEQWGSRVKFGTGIPLSRVMNPAFDIMIAYGQNGEKLAPDHGYPIRLIVPGYTAARNIKWLKQINAIPHVTRNHYYYHNNRVLPPHVSSEDAEVEDWFYKPEYIFNEHNINAAIAIPRHGEEILMTGESLSDDFNVGGYAYTGGGRAVTRVDISLDGGETWKLAKLDKKEKTTGYGMNWCWVWWDYKLTVADIIGVQEIYCRAWDSSNNRQPDKPIWNLMGMGNNHHYKLVVDFTKNKDGNNVFKFLHPIQAGEIKGGWMTERSGKPDTAGYGKVNSEADYNCRVEAAEGKSIYMSKIPDAVLKKASSTGDRMSLISS